MSHCNEYRGNEHSSAGELLLMSASEYCSPCEELVLLSACERCGLLTVQLLQKHQFSLQTSLLVVLLSHILVYSTSIAVT